MAIKISKDSSGTYTVRVWSRSVDVFGKRLTKQKSGIKTVTAAKQWGNLAEDEISEKALFDIADENELTFKNLSDKYYQSRIDKASPSSLDRIKTVLPQINLLMGDVKIKHINTRIVQQVIDKLSKIPNKNKPNQTIKQGTVKKYYSIIQAVINWGVAQGYLEYNKIKRIEFVPDNELFEPTIITPDEAGKLLKWLKTNYYNLYVPVLLAITTSPRRGEFAGLKWDNIDFEKGLIDFSNNRIMVGNQIIDKTRMKTRTSKRVLVMSDFLKHELIEHKKMCSKLQSDFVCANIFTGETPANPSYLTKTFHKIMEKEFGIKIRLHDLRHSFNQIGYEHNVDETTRSKIMGHSKTNTTRNIYTQVSYLKNKEAMDTISNEILKTFETVKN